jgi:hypothetical protein
MYNLSIYNYNHKIYCKDLVEAVAKQSGYYYLYSIVQINKVSIL